MAVSDPSVFTKWFLGFRIRQCRTFMFLYLNGVFFLSCSLSVCYPASSGFSRPDATLQWERKHCEQPFAFPSSMRVHVMTTNIQRQDGNENFNKTIGLISKTTTLHVHHAFIFACLILRFMDNANKQQPNSFFFSLLNLDMVPWNSTSFVFAYI